MPADSRVVVSCGGKGMGVHRRRGFVVKVFDFFLTFLLLFFVCFFVYVAVVVAFFISCCYM